nr:unnamed protein product [Haemonchus contortus]
MKTQLSSKEMMNVKKGTKPLEKKKTKAVQDTGNPDDKKKVAHQDEEENEGSDTLKSVETIGNEVSIENPKTSPMKMNSPIKKA